MHSFIRRVIESYWTNPPAGHVLDEVTLFLGGGVDGGTSGGLGLGATAHGKVRAGEQGAEDSHGELDQWGGVRLVHVSMCMCSRDAKRDG